MKQVKGLYKLSRPLSTLSGVLAVFLGGYVAGTGEWLRVTLAAVSTLLISAAANAWNDYLDVEIDKINQPQRPLPSGMVSLRTARNFSFILAVLSVVLAGFINWQAFLIAFTSNVLLYVYSLRMKSTVLVGNAIVAFISAMSAVFGGVAAGNILPTFWLAIIIVCGIMGREVLKTMADYEGDLSQRVRTIATAWGKRPARVVFYILGSMTLLMMMVPQLLRVYHPVYGYVVGFGVYPVVLYIMLRVTRERTGPQLEKLSQLMKYDFLIWFLAVMLGASIKM
ncbi:MAG: geranylgeranylglycerol-phosphate geranylgeranyltransferase [Chloroflexota bacterium]|nr:geranylgeranylglycerol-phosphate geranylgeranyltransferase [Ardenticatenaceae bacterium]MCB8989224.1 geranylgeranylglycerol-phosphate geranylgeranyltransferase [Ardenticatenaceae bacterium]